ncbi:MULTISPECIES: hypothetical protein [Rodentibacter]|uniref:hypothetical protein n=1 Tax=Rodentibacter TaxID=1960084 RepID=UPI001CFDAEBE|nr:hypothetical protein [Rodentibacter sp. JRC1]GJI56489.1 hypothetical protein HEMROJRC1_16010 [Rodentibacter sp. JRC1]
MKSSMKFALSLLLGSSVFVLTACDNQETKTTEKSTALAENYVVQAPQKAEASNVEETEKAIESTATDNTAKPETNTLIAENGMAEKIKTEETEAVSDVVKTEKSAVAENEVKKENKKKVKKSTKAGSKNSYLEEQKALLNALESQYEQVRCPAEAAKLGDNSFCRQEERRLSEEIKRVIDEIRLNQ